MGMKALMQSSATLPYRSKQENPTSLFRSTSSTQLKRGAPVKTSSPVEGYVIKPSEKVVRNQSVLKYRREVITTAVLVEELDS